MGRFVLLVAVIAACGGTPAGDGPDGAPGGPVDGASPPDAEVVDCGAVADALGLPGQVAANAAARRGRYPVVLSHGFFGFDQVGPLEYFVGVAEALREAGFAAYVTAVEPIASTDATRGPALALQIECIARAAGVSRLNLVGHSQGGLDVRFVASDPSRSWRVATVTTIATPHHGTPVADATLGLMSDITDDLADALSDLWSEIVDAPEADADLRAAMEQMAIANMGAWNAAHPDTDGIEYLSWTGVSGDGRDPVDPMLAATHAFIAEVAGPNDGLVDVDSARWGTFLDAVPADHFDEVGLFSINETNPFSGFNHRDFFIGIAADLEARGY